MLEPINLDDYNNVETGYDLFRLVTDIQDALTRREDPSELVPVIYNGKLAFSVNSSQAYRESKIMKLAAENPNTLDELARRTVEEEIVE